MESSIVKSKNNKTEQRPKKWRKAIAILLHHIDANALQETKPKKSSFIFLPIF